jgi:alkyl hydroperoxide reductase subunit F
LPAARTGKKNNLKRDRLSKAAFFCFNVFMFDLIIIGGGPAGAAAGVYAARKKMKFVLIADSFGGQSVVSADIQNWIGTKSISGVKLAQDLEEHLRAQEGMKIEMDKVARVEKAESGFNVLTEKNKAFAAKTVLVCSGSRRKKLGVPGEEEFNGKGVAYCSICDAPLFGGMDVAVIGGGNAGLEAAIDLIPYANKIYLLEFAGALKGDALTQEKIKANPKVEIILNAKTLEITGEGMVKGLKYEDQSDKEIKTLEVGGVFVEIGAMPNTEFLGSLVELDKFNEIVIKDRTQETSLEGIWAAGDATNILYKQNNIASGDAIKAVLNIYDYLNGKKQ